MPSPNTSSCASENVHCQLIAQASAVHTSDLDTSEAAIEIVILWGEHSMLHVEHLSPPRPYSVGDATDARGKRTTDFLIGSQSLGSARLPLLQTVNSRPAICIPAAASGDVTIDDQVSTFEQLRSQGQLQAADDMPAAQLYPLPFGATARLHFRGFTFVVKRTSAARKIGVGPGPSHAREHVWTAASLLFHASLLIAFQLLPPRSAALSLDLLSADSRLVAYMTEPPETVDELQPAWLHEDSPDANGGTGKRHDGDEGQMGKQDNAQTKHKFGVQGERADLPAQLSRETAKSAGIVGILRASTGSLNAVASPFGREAAIGQDPESALASLIGDAIGMNHGIGGLGARGTGRGGGGDGLGTIGVGKLGTVGAGNGTGTGDGSGYGSSAAGFRTRGARVPQIRSAPASIVGSLSKETIRRVIGRHINEVRYCYQQQLNVRPDLQGRVTTQFIIAPSGEVRTAAISSSDLGDAHVEQCIARAARRWIFPAPEGGGMVVVTYPFVLSQSGD